jgi:hypothetical protein
MLGIDKTILLKTSPREQHLYKVAELAFTIVQFLIVIADGYFGYFFDGSYVTATVAAICLGFIHYSVYRLALITLTTRPLTEEIIKNEALTGYKKVLSYLDGTSLFRTVFVCLVSLNVALLLALFLNCTDVENLQIQQRALLTQTSKETGIQNLVTEHTRFPFLVIQILGKRPMFVLEMTLLFCLIGTPLVLFSYLRHSPSFQYTILLQQEQREEVLKDYHLNVYESQLLLDKRFPGLYSLDSITAYSDAPFNKKLKKNQARVGTQQEMIDFLNTV